MLADRIDWCRHEPNRVKGVRMVAVGGGSDSFSELFRHLPLGFAWLWVRSDSANEFTIWTQWQ